MLYCLPLSSVSVFTVGSTVAAATFSRGFPWSSAPEDVFSPIKVIYSQIVYQFIGIPFNNRVLSSSKFSIVELKSLFFLLRLQKQQ